MPPKKRKCPSSPPHLDLGSSAVLLKSWEFVRDAEEFSGRKLAPLTGSRLEAQLLMARIEATESIEASPTPLTRSMSGIDELPNPLPGVSEQQWVEFRKAAFPP